MRVAIAVGLLLVVCSNGTGGETAASSAMEVFGPQRDWPRFRGPAGNGICPEKGLPTKWNGKSGEGIAWATEIPLGSYPSHPYASPIVFNDKVFIALANIKPVEHKLACFNKADGKLQWIVAIEHDGMWIPSGAHANDYSYTASTPCTDGERVYVVYGSGVIAAVDFSGKIVWRQTLPGIKNGEFAGEGIGNSPLIYKDMVLAGGGTHAYDRKTGALRYSVKLTEGTGHSSPLPVFLKSGPAILICTHTGIQGINPEDGKSAWTAALPKQDRHMATCLASGDGIVFGQRAIKNELGGAALSMDALAGATGDMTSKLLWTWHLKYTIPSPGEQAMPSCSPLVTGGYIYDRYDFENLACVEAATGQLMYTEHLPKGASAWGGVPFATADGLIYFVTAGGSYVVKAGPKFELVSTCDLGDLNFRGCQGDFAFNSAAVSEGKIFVQGHNKLWCIGKK